MDIFPPTRVNVSTLTVLLPFSNFSGQSSILPSVSLSHPSFILDSFIFYVANNDQANTVTVVFETSEDGVCVDTDRVYSYTIGPGVQCSYEEGPMFVRTYYSITAETSGPSYPTASVTWGVRGILKNPGDFLR